MQIRVILLDQKVKDIILQSLLILFISIILAVINQVRVYYLTEPQSGPVVDQGRHVTSKRIPNDKREIIFVNQNLLQPASSKQQIKTINLATALILFKSKKTIFIDARSYEEYLTGHIRGAIPSPVISKDPGGVFKLLKKNKNKLIVTYCHGTECNLSKEAAEVLWDFGYKKVCVFFGGWDMWKEARYPIEQGDEEKYVKKK